MEAVDAADHIVLGPGSWYTSVLTHLLVPDLRDALTRTTATKILTLNLEMHTAETRGFSATQHIRTLHAMAPDLRFDVVLADPGRSRTAVASSGPAACWARSWSPCRSPSRIVRGSTMRCVSRPLS